MGERGIGESGYPFFRFYRAYSDSSFNGRNRLAGGFSEQIRKSASMTFVLFVLLFIKNKVGKISPDFFLN
jgi:hypothetical protein